MQRCAAASMTAPGCRSEEVYLYSSRSGGEAVLCANIQLFLASHGYKVGSIISNAELPTILKLAFIFFEFPSN